MTIFEPIELIAFLGTYEMVILGLVVLVLFGGAKLPSLMRNMGRSINEFKTGMNEMPQDTPRKVDDASTKPQVEQSEEIVNH